MGSGAEPLEDDDPRRIGPIPLLGRLGVGGMGRVYLGVHEGRYAAVKQVLPSVAGEDKDFLRRFGHELDNLARLPEDATAPLLAGDREARPPWFATAYVPGITLRQAVDLHGPLPAGALWLLLGEAARGLAAVHALDMVHRDLKPSNVMLTLEGLTLIDFGVARAAEQSQLTRTGMVVGTPAYMSPEQASGRRASSGVVDVFALGSVLAYAASGRPPFGDESGHAVLYRIVHEEPDLQPLRDLDAELADVVASCLDKDHEGRPTAAELLELAQRHGASAAAPWPEDITERLTERAAFAARTPHPDDLPPPEPTAQPDPTPEREPEEKQEQEQEQEQEKKPEPEPERKPEPKTAREPDRDPDPDPVGRRKPEKSRKERSRRRIRPVLVPVVVVVAGGTLAFQLLPYVTDSSDAAGPDARASVTASTTATPSGTGTGSAAPSPSTSASSPKKPESEAKESATASGVAGTGSDNDGSGAKSDEGSGDGAGGGDAGSGAGGGGSSSDQDPGTGTGSDDGTGTDPGSGDGAPSTGGGTVLRNGQTGHCVTVAQGNIRPGSCSGEAAVWNLKGASSGTYRVVHKASGNCLSSYGSLHAAYCSSQSGQEWRLGSGSSLVATNTGRCMEESTVSGLVMMQVCDGSALQHWSRSS
ncbi:protein kinase [Streptomyces sp. NPDC057245]|uniref:serine/threonine-protein kinase n=1 Tax=Streptomyces sp. NPDC057245 TaxID=3346065 RepID=UPI0036440F55